VFTADGSVLVTSGQGLQCFDSQAALKWSQDIGDVPTPPAVDDQGRIYAASPNGVLRSFEADGTPRWSYDLTPRLREVWRDERRAWAQQLREDLKKPDLRPDFRKELEGFLKEAEAQIAAPDAGYTGTPKITGGPSVAPDGSVYCFTEVGPLFKIGSDGQLVHEIRLPGQWLQARGVGFTPEGGVLAVTSRSSLLALRPDDRLDFEYAGFEEKRLDQLTPEQVAEVKQHGNTGAWSRPRLSPDGTRIYFGGRDGKIRAVDRNGQKLWTKAMDDQFGSAGGMPPGVPTSNIDALIDAVEAFDA
jgi:outer membrane protein assembly factor BamB